MMSTDAADPGALQNEPLARSGGNGNLEAVPDPENCRKLVHRWDDRQRMPKVRELMTPRAIEKAKLNERITLASESVTAWAESRLMVDTVLPDGTIPELYADYAGFCRNRGCPALPRKAWIATMKLAGFETRAGAFVDVILKGSEAVSTVPTEADARPKPDSGWAAWADAPIEDSNIPF